MAKYTMSVLLVMITVCYRNALVGADFLCNKPATLSKMTKGIICFAWRQKQYRCEIIILREVDCYSEQ